MANKKNLLLLLERPFHPFSMVKEGGPKFDVPNTLRSVLHEESPEIQNPFAVEISELIQVIPDLEEVISFDRREPLSLFIPHHRQIADLLIKIFMDSKIDCIDLENIAVSIRDHVNAYLFSYAFSVALLHRPDTKHFNLQSIVETFPEKFIDSKGLRDIRESVLFRKEGNRGPVILSIPSASHLEPEHRLWYFREDIGINLHHWHWHSVYPNIGGVDVVNKDRRGELFYYMHQQIIARYNFERFSNKLNRVQRLKDFREPITEAYFPKLYSHNASKNLPARPANTILSDLNRPADKLFVDIKDLERWERLFVEACHVGYVKKPDGEHVVLDEQTGIDILGNIMESTQSSINPDLYGDLHNMCHNFIALAHDPDYRHLEKFGVIGEVSTAMRDPAFYRLHAYVDDLFQEHKERLPKYTTQQLDYPGIVVTTVEVHPNQEGVKNTFQTFWQQSDIEMSRGLDFVPRDNVFARITHLQHTKFEYRINVVNNHFSQAMGTCRIFMAPMNDETGNPIYFNDQRQMMTELDKFTVALNPGNNIIKRLSTASSVTIPFERTFPNFDSNRLADGTLNEEKFHVCGCGWPQHMLIPKGSPGAGLPATLFVMISNYEDDRIDQDLVGTCNDAASFCGLRDRLYPDRRSMGYPFDRLPDTGVDSLKQFLTPNMAATKVTIIHNEITVEPGQKEPNF